MNLTQLEKFTIDKQMDYEINSSFPPQVTEDLKPLIEFRIKLLLKSDICIQPGESQLVQTACTLNKKIPNMSIHIKQYEKLPWNLIFESEKHIPHKSSGRISVKVINCSPYPLSLPTSSPIGYLILQPSTSDIYKD